MLKWSQEEEEKLIELLKDGLSYKDIAIELNRTSRSIKEKANKLGYNTNSFISYTEITCNECGVRFNVSKRNKDDMKRKFCSSSCSATFNNKKRLKKLRTLNNVEKVENVEKKYCLYCGKEISINRTFCNNSCHQYYLYNEYIKRWKNGEENGKKGEYSISNHIRRYLYEKYENKCSLCGWNKINQYTNKIPLEIEHIDGDYNNNKEENLILICPNCHSLTKTYKGANKGKGRKNRNKYYLI